MASVINFRIPVALIEQKLEAIRARIGGEPADLTAQLAASLALKKVVIPGAHCKVGKSYLLPVSSEPERAVGVTPGEVVAPARSVAAIIEANAEAGIASRLSPSQVRTFMDCQARWKFDKVDGLESITTGNQALGRAMHAALAHNFTQKIDSKRDLPVSEVLAAFDVAMAAELATAELRDDEDPAELLRIGRALLDKFMTEAPTIKPVAVEHEVIGMIAGVKVKGFIDVLDSDGRIHDFKTASKSPSGVEPDQMFQVATYAELEPRASGEARIHALVKNKTPKLVQLTRTIGPEDLEAIYTQYPLAQEAMRSGLYMPNRQSLMCSRKNCSYWRECETEFGGKVPLT